MLQVMAAPRDREHRDEKRGAFHPEGDISTQFHQENQQKAVFCSNAEKADYFVPM